jgi:hypothetical protein
MHTKFLSENLKERDHFEYVHVDGKITLKYILNMMWECELDSNDVG